MTGLLDSLSNNILLSNLLKIRWIAIIGQLSAILLVYYYFNINIPILLCLLIVLISTLVNIYSFYLKKNNNYLSDYDTFYFLLFDTIQLAIVDHEKSNDELLFLELDKLKKQIPLVVEVHMSQ